METKKISGVEVHCAFDDEMDVVDLVPNPRNPNRHDDRQIALLAKIIRSQGWRNPIVISERSGFIVAGHGRMEAARVLNVEKVPVDHQAFGSEAEEYAHLIADNRIAELAEADRGELGELIKELEGKIDLDLTGFDAPGLEELLGELEPDKELDAEPQIDKANELQAKWKTALGQVWELGDHRLLCGDCTDADTVAQLMGGERAEICFTSPPYNAGSLNIKGNNSTLPKYVEGTDNMAQGDYLDFLNGFISAIKGFSDEQFVNLGLVQSNKLALVEFMNTQKSNFKDLIYWVKSNCAPHIQQGVMNSRVELIICLGDENRKFRSAQFSQGTRANFIEGPPAIGNEFAGIHKATFPLYLPTDIVANFSNKGALVIEPFLGSGTTLMACENLGRKCRAIEIAPAYVAVTLERWAEATGKTPKLTNGA